ncbi:MAG: hypothetical protein OXK16_07700, partial [bacterium]|nr:hypothetical protein [bacterium]
MRYINLSAALVLVVSLVGCGADSEGTDPGGLDPFAPQAVSLGWPHCSAYAELQDAIIGFRDDGDQRNSPELVSEFPHP